MDKQSINLNQQDLLNILRSTPDMYLILTPKFVIVEASDTYLKATMVKRNDIIGRNIFDVFPDNPDDLDASGARNLRSSLENVIKNKSADTMAVQKYDVRRPHEEDKSFEERYWSPVNTPVFDEKKNILYIIHRAEDVTEFVRIKELGTKQLEINGALASRAGQMESEIYQRAQEIQDANNKLRIAKELAEQANLAKSTFLATMSHEIRTPLNGVIGMTSLLEGTALSEQQQEYIKFIRLSGEALLTLINDILDFSKIESGKFEVDYVDFDLRQVIEDAIEMTSYKAHTKNLAIGALIPDDIPEWVNTDASRLSQILINLLNNAVKFTENGQIELKVSRIKEKKADDEIGKYITLLFEVKDTGIGISQKVMGKLFKSFSQGDASVSRKYGGSGLGLVICQKLLEFLGGTIGVNSVPGEGSLFWFTIKMKVVKAHSPAAMTTLLPKLKGIRVLVVDDNDINRCILKAQIKSWGMHCDIAADGHKALKLLTKATQDRAPFQLILIDYNMPGMDGLKLAQKILLNQEIKTAPLLMLTSLGLPVAREQLDKLNILTCLTKPVRQSKLYDAIVSVLLNSSSHPSAQHLIEKKPALIEPKKAAILLVEDNAINQQVAVHILETLGYSQVDISNNGVEAVDAFKKKSYDLILMDCQMPEMDGYTATNNIRKIEASNKLKPVPIIAMTAHALIGDKEQCLDAGMNDHLAKPINIAELEKKVGQWLSSTPEVMPQEDTTETAREEKLLDMERLQLIFGNNELLKQEFLNSFIHDVDNLLKEISMVIQQKDKNSAKAKCHRLKGSSGNTGANQLYQLAIKQEDMVIKGQWKQAAELQKELLVVFKKLNEFVVGKCM